MEAYISLSTKPISFKIYGNTIYDLRRRFRPFIEKSDIFLKPRYSFLRTLPQKYAKIQSADSSCKQCRHLVILSLLNFQIAGVFVGVVELCNKEGRSGFSRHDEQRAKTFALYCATSLSHVSFFPFY